MSKGRLDIIIEMLEWCDMHDANFEQLVDYCITHNKLWAHILHNRKNIAIIASHCAILQGIPFDDNYEIFSVIDYEDYLYLNQMGFEIIPEGLEEYLYNPTVTN